MSSTKWVNFIWVILGALMFLTGLSSQSVVTIVVGFSLTFGHVSLYLTSHVTGDSNIKKGVEFISIIATFGVFGYGYVVTQSLLLRLMIYSLLERHYLPSLPHIFCPNYATNQKTVTTQDV